MAHPLADARREAKFSQGALAELAGCTRESIARIEMYRQTPSLALVAKIVSALKAKDVELSADAFLPRKAA